MSTPVDKTVPWALRELWKKLREHPDIEEYIFLAGAASALSAFGGFVRPFQLTGRSNNNSDFLAVYDKEGCHIMDMLNIADVKLAIAHELFRTLTDWSAERMASTLFEKIDVDMIYSVFYDSEGRKEVERPIEQRTL